MTVPADPRKLADTVRMALANAAAIMRGLMTDPEVTRTTDLSPEIKECDAAHQDLDALVSQIEQLRTERDDARKTRDAKYRDVEQAARELSVERAARESAEAALRAAQQESAELRAALTDELDNWNPERRPTIAAELRAAQARADELGESGETTSETD